MTEFIQQLALVSETAAVSESDLGRASAALQKQLTRDFIRRKMREEEEKEEEEPGDEEPAGED